MAIGSVTSAASNPIFPLIMLDQTEADAIIADRQARGVDRFDEVWEGQYMMAPNASWDHQDLAAEVAFILHQVAKELGGYCHQCDNVTDRDDDWTKNYRIPDVLVVLPGSKAKKFSGGLIGGPDFVVEILSPGDRSVDKLPFYAKVGSREVLHIDQSTKSLTLFRLSDGQMINVGSSTAADSAVIASNVLPLSFQVLKTQAPQDSVLEIRHADGARVWRIGG